MKDYQRGFLEFAIQCEALRFGEFTLKSGRISPYFFNSGRFYTGATLARLGEFYASAAEDSGLAYDMLYGPAYKGIPLVATMSIALAQHHKRETPYAFNRKEVKKYGEGGLLIGAPISGRVLIVDDVISSGVSVRESIDIIKPAGGQAVGVAIALDRQERGEGDTSAVDEVEGLGLQVISIARLEHLIAYLEEKDKDGKYLKAINAYRKKYGR